MGAPAHSGSKTPRDQWRARSKKSAVQRKHKLKTSVLAKNLEKVENIQYQKERSERDRVRMNEGSAVAGHHNLPNELLKVQKKPEKKREPVTQQLPPATFSIGFIRPERVRSKLQALFDVEKE
eukprot:TRINITY_DN2612_c0_g1_i1.p1 TRINITY_DN2612_c0_g1~~TRINITY_DN2612_c0_g1_i1.p1  ORF type:complete len:123 (+),score=17.65 TRINITY_DN2612_c0_g1_i1:60-428(+)